MEFLTNPEFETFYMTLRKLCPRDNLRALTSESWWNHKLRRRAREGEAASLTEMPPQTFGSGHPSSLLAQNPELSAKNLSIVAPLQL